MYNFVLKNSKNNYTTQNYRFMKKIKFMVVAMLMMCSTSAFAQRDINQMNDKELSAWYGQQIDEMNAKIKLVKTQIKGDKANVELQTELTKLNAEVKKAKEDKKVIDNAIKAEAKAEKAIENAEKMAQKAEKAKKDAERMKKEAAEAARKALQIRK